MAAGEPAKPPSDASTSPRVQFAAPAKPHPTVVKHRLPRRPARSASPSASRASYDSSSTIADSLRSATASSIRSLSSLAFQDSKRQSQSPARRGPSPLVRGGSRVRESSPPPARFQPHVSFDNFTGGDTNTQNTIAFTLNVRHSGYHRERESRTFMVGVDDQVFSEYALQWMLDELVDDGDEIVCVRVVDKDAKISSDKSMEKKLYREEARRLMDAIQSRNGENRAISIVLEFAVGKLHSTFQKMIQIYEPGMLVVGTKGRSLGGLQGLMANRNSFSKWCLQYSPIPVVVVRSAEKREKKKKKRANDPARQNYLQILQDSGVTVHETDISGNLTPNLDPLLSNNPDAEAHAVAAALALPARFDPTVRQYEVEKLPGLRKVDSAKSDVSTGRSESPSSRPSSPEITMKSPMSDTLESPAVSGGEESDEEGEFEAIPGELLLHEPTAAEKKEKLHMMEVDEAAALAAGRKDSIGSTSSSGSGRDVE